VDRSILEDRSGSTIANNIDAGPAVVTIPAADFAIKTQGYSIFHKA